MGRAGGPLGVVLAGGAATRLGGDKAGALLDGRPLLAWAVAALRAAGVEAVAVTAKEGAPLPVVDALVWREPAEPRHPLAGLRTAIERGGDVLTLPVDLPLVGAAALRAVAGADLRGAVAAVACPGGRVQPLVGRFTPAARDHLPAAGRATDAVLALDPVLVDLPDDGFVNVNAPADLAAAEALVLSRRG
jgi:molybdopterin-guanine dinucleotide biosynthesis protein A